MKREIKFRGKRVDNGAWETGSFVKKGFESELQYSITDKITGYNTPVAPETVGQFTGLLDKNGTEIYEGDIVSVYDFSSAYSSSYTGEVIMRGGEWCVEYYEEYRCCPPLFFDDFADRKTEVIGNIYDNPALLKEWK